MSKLNFYFNGKDYSIERSSVEKTIAALQNAFDKIHVEEEQLDALNGTEYYTLAPSSLSFRSTAPFTEFQEVALNYQVLAMKALQSNGNR